MVFIDELDVIAWTRGEELSQHMVAALLALIDGVNKNHQILVITATNRPESIDPALRWPRQLDREFEINVPSPSQRFEILKAILHRINCSLTNQNLSSLASNTNEFVGINLTQIYSEALMSALRRYISMQNPLVLMKFIVENNRILLKMCNLSMKDIRNTSSSQNSIAPSDSLQ